MALRDDAFGEHGPLRAASILEAMIAQLGSARLQKQPRRFVVWATAHEATGDAAGVYSVDIRDGEGNRFSALWAEREARGLPAEIIE
jgi:hypothetical protein